MSIERQKMVIDLKGADKLFRNFESTLYKMSTDLTNRDIKDCFIEKGEDKYYYTLENQDKVPAFCPKCHKGHLFLRKYRCINPDDLGDEFWIELTACDNKHQCDFVSHENIAVKLGNKLITKNIESIEKRKNTVKEKNEYIKNLEQVIEENSWGNLFKALFQKSPTIVLSSLVIIVLVAMVAMNSLFGGMSQTLSAEMFNQRIDYSIGE